MIVDCDTCVVRGPSCGDCVVTFLLGPPQEWAVDGLPGDELAALAVLADSGLVPPLRLVTPPAAPSAPGTTGPTTGPRSVPA